MGAEFSFCTPSAPPSTYTFKLDRHLELLPVELHEVMKLTCARAQLTRPGKTFPRRPLHTPGPRPHLASSRQRPRLYQQPAPPKVARNRQRPYAGVPGFNGQGEGVSQNDVDATDDAPASEDPAKSQKPN